MTDETPKVVTPNTRCYILEDGTLEFRNGGAVVATLDVGTADPGVERRLAREAAARLYLHGKSIADILDGTAIPARTPPAAKTKANPVLDAIIAVRADELYNSLKRGQGRLPPIQLTALRTESEAAAKAWVAGLSADEMKRARRHAAVRARMLAGKNAGALGDIVTQEIEEEAPKPEPVFLHDAAE